MKREVIQELVKLADSLDKRGMRKESDQLDRILSKIANEEESYELVYSMGGHGGPHHSLEEARAYARKFLAGSASETLIYIVPSNLWPLPLGHTLATAAVDKIKKA